MIGNFCLTCDRTAILFFGIAFSIIYFILSKKIIKSDDEMKKYIKKIDEIKDKPIRNLSEQLYILRKIEEIQVKKWKNKKYVAFFIFGIMINLFIGFLATQAKFIGEYIVIILITNIILSKIVR